MITAIYLLLFLAQVATPARVLTRPDREPSSRIAWIAVPGVGILGYLLLGETNIGRERVKRRTTVITDLSDLSRIPGYESRTRDVTLPVQDRSIFRLGQTISGLSAVEGSSASLMADSDAAINAIVWSPISTPQRMMST